MQYHEDDDVWAVQPTYICLKGDFSAAMLALEGCHEIVIAVYRRETNFFYLVAPKPTECLPPRCGGPARKDSRLFWPWMT